MEHGLVQKEGAHAACEPPEDVQAHEGGVAQEGEDGRGHEVEGEAVEEDVRCMAVREGAGEHRVSELDFRVKWDKRTLGYEEGSQSSFLDVPPAQEDVIPQPLIRREVASYL